MKRKSKRIPGVKNEAVVSELTAFSKIELIFGVNFERDYKN